jgi:hypothetical protein
MRGSENEKAEGEKRNVHKKLHCSFCGHPGTKKQHNKLGCEDCKLNHDSNGSGDEQGCKPKDQGFTCTCQSCEDVMFSFFSSFINGSQKKILVWFHHFLH